MGAAARALLRAIERERVTSLRPAHGGIAFLRHPAFAPARLASLQKGYYGASIMPVPVLQELAARLPALQLYNRYGQSEIAPLATVLRPEEHAERPRPPGGRSSTSKPASSTATSTTSPQGEMGEIVHRSPQTHERLLGQAGGDRGQLPRRLVPPGTSATSTRPATLHHRPHQRHHQDRRRGGGEPRGGGVPGTHPRWPRSR